MSKNYAMLMLTWSCARQSISSARRFVTSSLLRVSSSCFLDNSFRIIASSLLSRNTSLSAWALPSPWPPLVPSTVLLDWIVVRNWLAKCTLDCAFSTRCSCSKLPVLVCCCTGLLLLLYTGSFVLKNLQNFATNNCHFIIYKEKEKF